jgi:threonine dehydrogenase-like Zn-dependent dehydrogenase
VRALIWDGGQLRFVADAPDPVALPGTAIVRVRLAGICSTDLQILRGYMGFRGILGHEFVGEVVAGTDAMPGQRVVGEINFACRRCADCLAGRTRHCSTRTVMGILGADGAFAELLRVPLENLRRVPAGIPDAAAVFVEPLAAAIEACDQTTAFVGGRSLVIGAGKLGLLVAQALAARGDRVEVLCRNAAARVVAESLELAVMEPPVRPRAYDLVVDASGDPAGLGLAIDAVRPLGAIVLKSTIAARHDVDLAPLVINEVSLIGSRCGNFDAAIAMLAAERVRVLPLLERVLPLEEGVEALERAGRAGALKVMLQPNA